MFVCVGLIVPLENCSLIWTRHHYRWRAEDVYLCSSLKVIEQLGFFSIPHLHWHGASVYNGHLQESLTLTPIQQWTITTCFNDLMYVCRDTKPSACWDNAFTHCATSAVFKVDVYKKDWADIKKVVIKDNGIISLTY